MSLVSPTWTAPTVRFTPILAYEMNELTIVIAGAGIKTTEEFKAACAEDGTTAQCCIAPLGSDGLLCTPA